MQRTSPSLTLTVTSVGDSLVGVTAEVDADGWAHLQSKVWTAADEFIVCPFSHMTIDLEASH